MRLLADNPATEDMFGFDRLADILYTVTRDTPYRPFTIGVFGEWGSGKTTLMKMIKDRVERDGIKTVWFNAWKYDEKEVIWNALIQKIFYTMRNDPDIQNRDDAEEFKERIARAAGGLARFAAKAATRFVPGGIIKEEDVDSLLEALGPSKADDALFNFINQFEATFDQLVKDYVGPAGYLVIFIDDLDRCLPENAITVMEALKLYLDRADCVFVIGAESSIIEEGINHRYRDNPRLSGKDYLEKVIQLPFIVPRIRAEHALSLLDPFEKRLPYRDDQDLQMLIMEGSEGNPRRLKRFVNSFSVLSKISGDPPVEHRKLLAKVLFIQMRFPALYYALAEDTGLADRIMDALALSAPEREKFIESSPQSVRALFADEELINFLDRTQNIPFKSEKIEHWVMLAKGEVADMAENLAGT